MKKMKLFIESLRQRRILKKKIKQLGTIIDSDNKLVKNLWSANSLLSRQLESYGKIKELKDYEVVIPPNPYLDPRINSFSLTSSLNEREKEKAVSHIVKRLLDDGVIKFYSRSGLVFVKLTVGVE